MSKFALKWRVWVNEEQHFSLPKKAKLKLRYKGTFSLSKLRAWASAKKATKSSLTRSRIDCLNND